MSNFLGLMARPGDANPFMGFGGIGNPFMGFPAATPANPWRSAAVGHMLSWLPFAPALQR